MPKMTDTEIENHVASQMDDAIQWSNTDLAVERLQAAQSYRGEAYPSDAKLPAGHSRVVTQDVLEVVEWMKPSLLRIFTSGDRVVQFNAQGPEDEAAASQETDAVNHVWSQQNNGFVNFYDAIHDALLQKLGVFKVEWFEGDERPVEEYEHLSEVEAQKLLTNQDLEVIEVEVETPESEGEDGEPAPVDPATGVAQNVYTVKVRPKKQGRIVVDTVPPEDFFVSRNSRSIDDAEFKAWRREVTISQARQMGFDVPDDIGRSSVEANYDVERQQRFKDEGGVDNPSASMDGALRRVWLVTSYVNLDVDGDGIAELRRVVTIERKLFENEEVTDHPFAELCPVRIPHKAIGMSIADLVIDLQLIKTTLVRQLLNNLYITNHPRTAVQADQLVSIDEMLDYRAGGVVRTLGPPGQAIFPMTVPFMARDVLPVMEMFEEMKASRSGVTKYNQGLDADTLNKTATGIGQIMNAAAGRIELVARIFAETGVRTAFLKIHGLLRRHVEAGRKLSLKLGGQWVDVNPREWRERTDMTVSVGLGTGDKTQLLQHLITIAGLQEKIIMMQGGANGPLVTLPNVYATASQMVENAGLKAPEKYFTDPAMAPPQPQQPPPPDPTQQAALMAVEIEKGKLQLQAQKQQTDAELARWKAEQDIALQYWKAEQEFALKGMQVDAQKQIAAAKAVSQPKPAASQGVQ